MNKLYIHLHIVTGNFKKYPLCISLLLLILLTGKFANGQTATTQGIIAINPAVTINQAVLQPDPANISPINFTVVFDQPVDSFITGDVVITGTAGGLVATVTGGPTLYNVAVSGMISCGTVIVNIPAGVCVNALLQPNQASTSIDNTVTLLSGPPNVIINQAVTQPDPTSVSPINFTVQFDQLVTGFATGDVTLSGTAGATTAIVTGSGAIYNVAVSGMTASGTVIATIAAGVAQACSQPNNASTSTDNTVTINCVPPVVNVTPATSCGGVAGLYGIALVAGVAGPPVPGSVTVNSGILNLSVPDNTANGISNNIILTGVPANATITNVSVTVNMSHTYPGDMIIHLKAPNGQILNLYKYNNGLFTGPVSGNATWGWYGAKVSQTGFTAWSTIAVAPFIYNNSTPWRADAINGPVAGTLIQNPTGFVSNAASFASLYSTGSSANGNWTLAMADGGMPGDIGILASWSLTIDYTTAGGPPHTFVWTPLAGLYVNSTATAPYTGNNTPIVYAAPTTSTIYAVTGTNTATGCSNTVTANINYTPPGPVIEPPSVNMCLGDPAVKLKITVGGIPATPATWSPINGLFSNAAATIAYVGNAVDSVWVRLIAAGVYPYQVTNQGLPPSNCTSPPRSVTVTVGGPVTITSQPANVSLCPVNTIAVFMVSIAGGPVSYQWQVSNNGGATWINAVGPPYSGFNTGTLTVTPVVAVMNGYLYRVLMNGGVGCSGATSNAALLSINPTPTVSITANPLIIGPTQTTTIFSTVTPNPATSYTWYYNNSVLSGATSSSLLVNYGSPGDYQLRVTDANNCGVGVSNIITIANSFALNMFTYPNPSGGIFQVRYYSEPNNTLQRSLTVYNNRGEKIITRNFTQTIPYQKIDIDVRANGKGLYWVEVRDANGKRLGMNRVVVQ
jgi:subtilisin-like proprotein convertase family protein